MGVGVLATSVLTLLTPVAANLSVWALVAVRVLEGLFEVREAQEYTHAVRLFCHIRANILRGPRTQQCSRCGGNGLPLRTEANFSQSPT